MSFFAELFLSDTGTLRNRSRRLLHVYSQPSVRNHQGLNIFDDDLVNVDGQPTLDNRGGFIFKEPTLPPSLNW